MLKFLKKCIPFSVIAMDLLFVPAFFLCRLLTQQMLELEAPCQWTLWGLQCATCGGTHCVQSFVHFDFAEAFSQNQLVFLFIILALVALVLLNLAFLFRIHWAQKAVRYLFSIPTVFILLGTSAIFILVRNLPQLIRMLLQAIDLLLKLVNYLL